MIFDSFLRAGAIVQRHYKIQELRGDIARIGLSCGDCDHWMKTGKCPRETGFAKNSPNMNSPICNSFVENPMGTKHREELQAKLDIVLKEAANENKVHSSSDSIKGSFGRST